MIRIALAVVFLAVTSPAYAIDRNCPKGQTWSISLGTCVKKKPAPKLSAQEKFDRANDDLEGKGRGADPKRGVRLLEENCTAGHGPSCTLLGFLYSRGRAGIATSPTKSMEFFVKACSLNDVEGCYHIGNVAYQIAEYPASRIAYQRACELGSGLACARGGELFERGIGGDKDAATSTRMFERAHALLAPTCPGDGSGCYVLGYLFEGGRGVPKDGAKAITAFRNGCSGGSGDACTKLAGLLDDNKDTDGANDALEKACNRYDNGDACRKLAERLAIAKTDLDRAFTLAKRGCSLDTAHCGTLGELYRVGFGVAANPTEATRLYKSACEAGGSWCDTFGQRAHDGVGMTKDDTVALTALERGCKGGDARSCQVATNILIENKTDDARAFTLASMGCDYKRGVNCYLAGWMSAAGRAGGPASPERAFALYERGCTLGSPAACSAQADAHRTGEGTPKDPAKAIAKAEEACTGTQAELFAAACKTWGVMAYFGETGAKDAKTALTAFRRACSYGIDTCAWIGSVAVESGGTIADELPTLEKACAAGYEHACTAYGNALAAGGNDAAHRKAYEAFVASCERKNEDACVRQADLLAGGYGVTKDSAKAEQLYRARCDAGSSSACFGMGRMYADAKKLDEALRMLARACDGGSGDACSSVGFMYYTAQGTRWDVASAAKFFTKGCELGSSVGCANSADLYRWGVGVKVDHAKAFGFYEKACTPADPAGCAGVGHYASTGEGSITIDRARAEQALRAACTSEAYMLPDACRELAELLERGGSGNAGEIARIRTTAFARAKELAADNPYFMYVLGTFFAEGVATVKDPAQALDWFGKACDGFDPLGCIAAGKALRATKKPDDSERARVYFERACAAGVDDGCTLGNVGAPAPAAVETKGCGCAGEIAGGDTGALLLVVVIVAGRKRRRVR
jgi:MYXO-CTERM domain-containing protein